MACTEEQKDNYRKCETRRHEYGQYNWHLQNHISKLLNKKGPGDEPVGVEQFKKKLEERITHACSSDEKNPAKVPSKALEAKQRKCENVIQQKTATYARNTRTLLKILLGPKGYSFIES